MKGENWSALKTDQVSVAQKKSNVATPQTSFRLQSILAVALSMWFVQTLESTTFVLSSYSPAYWYQEESFELSCYSAELLLCPLGPYLEAQGYNFKISTSCL